MTQGLLTIMTLSVAITMAESSYLVGQPKREKAWVSAKNLVRPIFRRKEQINAICNLRVGVTYRSRVRERER